MAGLQVELKQATPIPLDVAFECVPGQVMALVGPSGSGKSTILRAVAGAYRARAGRIVADGEIWFDSNAGILVPAHRRVAGIVFQSYALFPHMTALANVAAAMGHVPRHARAARAADLIAMVHLAGLEGRRPAELSGGQQQRVAVARALAREPKVLLLDEPFSAVDKATRARLYAELAALRRRLSMPVVLVTHDLDEALMLADAMCLLHRGRILQHGRPLDVTRRPVSVEAARLVGQRNVFSGRVIDHRPEHGKTLMAWEGHTLEIAHMPQFRLGEPIAWLIPASKAVLHRRDRPSRGEAENPVSGVIAERLVLGDTTMFVLHASGRPDLPITFHVPTHAADRNRLDIGDTATISLLADAIHLMPPASTAGA